MAKDKGEKNDKTNVMRLLDAAGVAYRAHFYDSADGKIDGVSVAGKVCGNLAQSSGGWRLPLIVMVATAAVGAALFACLWCVRANAYDE